MIRLGLGDLLTRWNYGYVPFSGFKMLFILELVWRMDHLCGTGIQFPSDDPPRKIIESSIKRS